jgi:hypothetical protein
LVNKDSTLSNNAHTDTITISKAAWNNSLASDSMLTLSAFVISTNVKDSLKDNQIGYLVIPNQTGESAGYQQVILKPGIYLKDNPFWIEAG